MNYDMTQERFHRLINMGLKPYAKVISDLDDRLILQSGETKIGITKEEWEKFKFECEILCDK
jgi:hypothetical protein